MNTASKKYSQPSFMMLQDTVSDIGLMTARSLRPRNKSTHKGKWEVFGGWDRVGLWTRGAEAHTHNRDMAGTDRETDLNAR